MNIVCKLYISKEAKLSENIINYVDELHEIKRGSHLKTVKMRVCLQIVHTCTINLGMIGSALRLVPSSIPTQISNDMKTRYLLKL